ncbi:unnamed protein product [Pleuronectes platessa]|uniref:IRS-type PTB domain-containing protein n=1 Tax=Pleuronectes platessa TaxID=8262 RepID=A0A9N7YN77_PLEPL|nr:unnamed protein product [Pleuronectes platessa]
MVHWAAPAYELVRASVKRGSMQRGSRVEEDEGMEDNSLYSGRQQCVLQSVCAEDRGSDHCRLRGTSSCEWTWTRSPAQQDRRRYVYMAVQIPETLWTGQVDLLFEAGRRCASGEGSFEFDTKQGNVLFSGRIGHPLRRTAPPTDRPLGGAAESETPQLNLPPTQSRTLLLPPQPAVTSTTHAAQAEDAVYSTVTEHHLMSHHKESSTTHWHSSAPCVVWSPSVDKVLTAELAGFPVPERPSEDDLHAASLPHASRATTVRSSCHLPRRQSDLTELSIHNRNRLSRTSHSRPESEAQEGQREGGVRWLAVTLNSP